MSNEQEVKKSAWDVICHICTTRTGIDPSKVTPFGGLVLLLFALGPVAIPALLQAVSSRVSGMTNTASVVNFGQANGVLVNGSNNNVQVTSASESNFLTLEDTKWTSGLGELAIHGDKIFLPPKINSGTRRYITPLPREAFSFETRFIPFGTNAANFVISIPGVYEIIIGDNDYRHIVLKRSVKGDETPRVPVLETKSQSQRALFEKNILREREVAIIVNQELLGNGKLWVKLTIEYWAENQLTKDTDTFEYEFEPSPWFEDSLFLHLGLIQDSEAKDIAVKVLNPSIFEELDNS